MTCCHISVKYLLIICTINSSHHFVRQLYQIYLQCRTSEIYFWFEIIAFLAFSIVVKKINLKLLLGKQEIFENYFNSI